MKKDGLIELKPSAETFWCAHYLHISFIHWEVIWRKIGEIARFNL